MQHKYKQLLYGLTVTCFLTQVNVAKGNTAQVAGRDLELVQWHFHTPSEHAFDEKRKSMEVHLVHKDVKTGRPSAQARLSLVSAYVPAKLRHLQLKEP